MGTLPGSPLGKATRYADQYDPALLYVVERAPQRAALGLHQTAPLPFDGTDAWTAWEANWLDAQGKPQVGVVRFDVPAASPCIVESKSVKLYFTALNGARIAQAGDYVDTLTRDLSAATGASVRVRLIAAADYPSLARAEPDGQSIDALPLCAHHDQPLAAQLATLADPTPVTETLTTRLFRSVCPVTGQPDYASVRIAYRGARIDREALLAYLVAYRRQPGFHEHCVERIFVDLCCACAPQALAVSARFTRRGGIDINPSRWIGDASAGDDRPTLVQ